MALISIGTETRNVLKNDRSMLYGFSKRYEHEHVTYVTHLAGKNYSFSNQTLKLL